MLRGESYLCRLKACGDLADVMFKALQEATKITANGKTINWPEEELPPTSPIVVYFDDGSFISVADVLSPLSKNTKTTWGTYTDSDSMN